VASSPTSAPNPAGSRRPPAQPPNASQNGSKHRIVADIDRFWRRVTEGLQVSELWVQFKRDAQTGYQLYRRDYEAGVPADQRKSFFQRVQELMWAILSKLTPARRVLLLIGIVLLLFPSGSGFQFQHGDTNVEITAPNFQFWGGLALFVLLMLEIADRVVMKRDLEIARDIQSWLLPSTPPAVPGLAIAFATRPANTVAGDYYDVFARKTTNSAEEGFLLAVADVAGKSIPAALLMATFQASLKTLSATPCSLIELVMGMNRYACCNSQGGLRFTTAFIAEFNPATRVVQYINAGHNTPILRRNSGATERLGIGGVPLGIQQDAAYAAAEVTLASGDWLVIFTDGLVEAENQVGEPYGEDRLLGVLQSGVTATPDVMLQRMIAEVNSFVGSTPQHDEITCMVIKAT
jgi:sigma-B regulation protein RsbU (phosphoserine phosphatase)